MSCRHRLIRLIEMCVCLVLFAPSSMSCLILCRTHREYVKCLRPFDLSCTWETWACVQFSSTRLGGHTVYHLDVLEWLVQLISVAGCVWAWCSFRIYWVYNLSSLVILLTRTSVKDWTALSSISIVNVMFWWTPCSTNSCNSFFLCGSTTNVAYTYVNQWAGNTKHWSASHIIPGALWGP